MSEKPAVDKSKQARAESPTTARELDFDDDNETPAVTENKPSPPPPSKSPKPGVRFSESATEIPPPKPPRPVNRMEQDAKALADMFPDTDAKVIKAVLVASGGDVERAMNALLSMNDPNFTADELPPPKPPRPSPGPRDHSYDDDFLLAQRLQQEEQQRAQRSGQGSRERVDPRMSQSRRQNEAYDREHSFFDDDLPEIRKNIEQGFKETQNKVSKWVEGFMKKLDGEPEEYDQYGNAVPPPRRHNFGPSQSDQQYGIRRSTEQRRSADHNRYDMDNRVLGDNFEALELRDDDAPPRPNRPQANPNLFTPTPVSPPQTGPVDEVDALYRNPSPNNASNTNRTPGSKKWQPLTSVSPNPEPEDHDPFSLGDSDDEDAKKDIKAEDTERLKKAAEGKEGNAGHTELKEAGRSGSVGQRDAAAEALLKDTK
jgi:hypothetical protein